MIRRRLYEGTDRKVFKGCYIGKKKCRDSKISWSGCYLEEEKRNWWLWFPLHEKKKKRKENFLWCLIFIFCRSFCVFNKLSRLPLRIKDWKFLLPEKKTIFSWNIHWLSYNSAYFYVFLVYWNKLFIFCRFFFFVCFFFFFFRVFHKLSRLPLRINSSYVKINYLMK